MWLPSFIKKKLVREALSASQGNKNLAMSELSEELKGTTKEYKDALKESEDLRKILSMRQRINTIKQKTQDLEDQYNNYDDEDDEDEEDPDLPQDLEQFLGKTVQDLIKSKMGGPQPSPAALPGQNSAAPAGLPEILIDKYNSLSPTQQKELLEKFAI